MTTSVRTLLAVAALLMVETAAATYHTFRIEQIFSNADGSVQFVVLHEAQGMDGQNVFGGRTLRSAGAGTPKTYTFPGDLPGGSCGYYGCESAPTADRRVLIATQSFAALGLVTPDYVIPDGFLPLANGTVDFAGVDQFPYASLPTDGVTALYANGPGMNRATNFAGRSASVAAVASAVDLNQHGLTGSWWESASDGQGLEVEIFPNPSSGTGSIFVSWFTYDTVIGGAERQRWYTAQGQAVTGQPNAALTIYRNTGGNFNALPVTEPLPVGTATLSFATCASGQLAYNFTDGTGRTGTLALTRLTQNVTCSTSGARPINADFALSGNWFDRVTSGQGLTIEANPHSGIVFAAWYTYAPNGTSAGAAGQRWYTAQSSAPFTPGARSIPLTLYETTGGVFDTPKPPGQQTLPVGSATLTFRSCAEATFGYTFTAGTSSGASGNIALQRVGPVPAGCTG